MALITQSKSGRLFVEFETSSCRSYLGTHLPTTVIPFNSVFAGFGLQIAFIADTWFTNKTASLTAGTEEKCVVLQEKQN
jgi:hypothetical protein